MGRPTVQRLSNLVRVSSAYDDANRLVRLANLNSTGVTLSSFRDTWDGAGNRLHRQEADGTLVTWSYDSSYQLTRERRGGSNSYDTTYAYDAAGNRTLKLDNAVRTTYSYDAANQTQKYVDNTGTTTFAFDANGNQRLEIASAGGGTTTNSWDFENRLIKVALPSGILNTFSYNGDGRRVKRQDSAGTLIEVWDGQKILLETDASNVTQVIYTLSPGVYGDLISQRRSGTSSYYLFDPLGSADRLTNGGQGITDTYIYKAFGEILLGGATANPFRFVGRLGYYLDADLSLYVARARELSATLARWMTVDPIPRFVGDSNVYNYVMHRPVDLVDPSGLAARQCCCTWRPLQIHIFGCIYLTTIEQWEKVCYLNPASQSGCAGSEAADWRSTCDPSNPCRGHRQNHRPDLGIRATTPIGGCGIQGLAGSFGRVNAFANALAIARV